MHLNSFIIRMANKYLLININNNICVCVCVCVCVCNL